MTWVFLWYWWHASFVAPWVHIFIDDPALDITASLRGDGYLPSWLHIVAQPVTRALLTCLGFAPMLYLWLIVRRRASSPLRTRTEFLTYLWALAWCNLQVCLRLSGLTDSIIPPGQPTHIFIKNMHADLCGLRMYFHMSQSAQPEEIFFDQFSQAMATMSYMWAPISFGSISTEELLDVIGPGSDAIPARSTALGLRVSAVIFLNVGLEAFRMARLLRWWFR